MHVCVCVYMCVCVCMGFPASGKEPTCHCRRQKKHGFDPWIGKISWRRAWQPTPVFFFLIKFIYFFNWRVIALQNFLGFCRTSTWVNHRYTYVPSLLNVPPISLPIPQLQVVTEHSLQYSCLENPKDKGAWQTIVHRVVKSQTLLKRLSMHAYVYICVCVYIHSNGYTFPFLLCFPLLFFSQLFVRPTQAAILLFYISFSWGLSWSLSPVQCHKPPSIVHQALYQI